MSGQGGRKRKLTVRWSKRENDFVVSFPRSQDGWLANQAFFSPRCHPDLKCLFGVQWDPSFADELKRRGYDMTTLRFSIEVDEDKAFKMTTTPKTLDEVLAAGRIRLGACGRAVVRLPAPGATGYLWSASVTGPITASTQWDESQRQADEKEPPIGSSPDVLLDVRKGGEGEATVTVVLKRPWEDGAFRTHVLNVA